MGTLVTLYERNFSRKLERIESQPNLTVNDGNNWRTDGEEYEAKHGDTAALDPGHKDHHTSTNPEDTSR